MSRHSRPIVLIAAMLFWLLPRAAVAQNVTDVVITEFGIYTSRLQSKEPSSLATTGFVNRVTDVKLVERTERICARLELSFGVTYLVVGTPAGATIELEMRTLYPAPGVVDPSGKRHLTTSFIANPSIGGSGFRSFTFEYAWEIISGEWVFEFLHRGRKVAEQRFTVATACGIS